MRTSVPKVENAIMRVLTEDFDSLSDHLVKNRLEILAAGWHWKRRNNTEGKLPRPFILKYRHRGIKKSPIEVERLWYTWSTPRHLQFIS